MASIVYRGPYQWQAFVRKAGYKTQTKTLESEEEAKAWAREVEQGMAVGTFVDHSVLKKTTLGQLLERYLKEVTPKKRGWQKERYRIKKLLTLDLALRPLASLRPIDFAEYRNSRTQAVKPKSVREELMIFSAMFNHAKKEWFLPVENHINNISKPSPGPGRERRLLPDEEGRLLKAIGQARKDVELRAAVVLALETGMRRGEIAGLEWERVNFQEHKLRLDLTKNGEGRTVPLSKAAQEALESLRGHESGKVFTFPAEGLTVAFHAACVRAGIEGLRLHDLRHERASRWAPHMRPQSLAKLMGWKTLQIAMRYYNPTDAELVALARDAEHKAELAEKEAA